jgi:hypothetical protein
VILNRKPPCNKALQFVYSRHIMIDWRLTCFGVRNFSAWRGVMQGRRLTSLSVRRRRILKE